MKLNRNISRLIVLALLWPAAAFPRPLETLFSKGLDFPLTQYKLANGLQVILMEDDSLPLVSVVVAYGVGPVREPEGKSGLAYLMENLMFQGSDNVSPMQHINFIQRIGGEFNANTAFDKTFFYETVPSNQLALALWLESDRMASLNITGTNVERAKNTLLEEHRQRKVSEPYMESFYLFDKILFTDSVYNHPLIGTEADISAVTEEDVRSFSKAYYVPNNAVLAVSGSIQLVRTKELIAKYFETIPRGNDIPEPPAPRPEALSPNKMLLNDPLAPSPAFHYGSRFGRLKGSEYYGLKILDILLLRGKSSRLFKRIVKKDKLALYINGGVDERRSLVAFKLFAVSSNSIMSGLCQKAVSSEINKLKTSLVSESELTKAKVLFQTDCLNRLSTSLQKALFMSEAFLSNIRLEDLPSELNKYLQVTPLTIAGLANRFFTSENTFIMNLEMK